MLYFLFGKEVAHWEVWDSYPGACLRQGGLVVMHRVVWVPLTGGVPILEGVGSGLTKK